MTLDSCNGAPDADAVLAIVALMLSFPVLHHSRVYELVNRFDIDPIGIDLYEEAKGVELAWFNQVQGLKQSEAGFRKGITAMTQLLTDGVSYAEQKRCNVRMSPVVAQPWMASTRFRSPRLPVVVPQPPLGPVRRGADIEIDKARIVVTHSLYGVSTSGIASRPSCKHADRIGKLPWASLIQTRLGSSLDKQVLTRFRLLGDGWVDVKAWAAVRGVRYGFDDIQDVTVIIRYLSRN